MSPGCRGCSEVNEATVSAAPAGLFFGRIANFINGELWGKPTDVPWAVIFPESAPPGTPVWRNAGRLCKMVGNRHRKRSQSMLATADAAVQLATRRKRTGNGWNTPFIGKNRNTIGAEAPPPLNAIYPMAFLVEKDAGAVVKPHFHIADQYQVVIQGEFGLIEQAIGACPARLSCR